MDAQHARSTGADASTTFLASIYVRLDRSIDVFNTITERLNAAGFYPGPQATSDKISAPVENNQRATIDGEIERISQLAEDILQQVNRLVG